jgi:hypothetical protein
VTSILTLNIVLDCPTFAIGFIGLIKKQLNMKKISSLQSEILVLLFLIISPNSFSQVSYSIIPEISTMTIMGTSSIHDWEMEVTEMECTASLIIDNDHIMSIGETRFSCETTSIVSDYKLMDKKTYEALKAEKYSTIMFRMTSNEEISPSSSDFHGQVKGYLSVAGKTKEIDVPFQGRLLANGKIELKGEVTLKMSEFDIDPPTALLGTLKTDNEVMIAYSLQMEREVSGNSITSMNSSRKETK